MVIEKDAAPSAGYRPVPAIQTSTGTSASATSSAYPPTSPLRSVPVKGQEEPPRPQPSPSRPQAAPDVESHAIPAQTERALADSAQEEYTQHPPQAHGAADIPMATAVPNHAQRMPYLGLSYLDAFLIHLFLGFFGGLHFRMGRWGLGFIYFFTVGGFGLGYIIDFVRLIPLVLEYNDKEGKLRNNESYQTLVWDSYAIAIPGLLMGMNHFYLKRWSWGVFYFFTLGAFGMGWLLDLFRMPYLVSQYMTKRDPDLPKYNLADAYVCWFPPLGLLGAHHLYLGDGGTFMLYFFTLGLFGVGWLIDGCRLSGLVDGANKRHLMNRGQVLYGQNNHVPEAIYA